MNKKVISTHSNLSVFIVDKIHQLLSTYQLRYNVRDGSYRYYIYYSADDPSTEPLSEPIALRLCSDREYPYIDIEAFHPRLNRQKDSRYLSAATLILALQHFGRKHNVPRGIIVEIFSTVNNFNGFYNKLKDLPLVVTDIVEGDSVISQGQLYLSLSKKYTDQLVFDELADNPVRR